MINDQSLDQVREHLRTRGFALVRGEHLDLPASARAYQAGLAAEWDALDRDNYLKGGARFRERRYGRYCYLPSRDDIQLLEHQPYYQSRAANGYAGGIRRHVSPLTTSSVHNPLLDELIRFDFAQFPVADEHLDDTWSVACHQFRIIATPEEVGDPTPEGIHRDEIDFGAIHLMSRTNAAGGISRVYDDDRQLLAQFQLQSALDTMFWADSKILHAVTPITVLDPPEPAVRDILILGYTRTPGLRTDRDEARMDSVGAA